MVERALGFNLFEKLVQIKGKRGVNEEREGGIVNERGREFQS